MPIEITLSILRYSKTTKINITYIRVLTYKIMCILLSCQGAHAGASLVNFMGYCIVVFSIFFFCSLTRYDTLYNFNIYDSNVAVSTNDSKNLHFLWSVLIRLRVIYSWRGSLNPVSNGWMGSITKIVELSHVFRCRNVPRSTLFSIN